MQPVVSRFRQQVDALVARLQLLFGFCSAWTACTGSCCRLRAGILSGAKIPVLLTGMDPKPHPMRLSQYPINHPERNASRSREVDQSPAHCFRAGLIRRLAAGLYSWLSHGTAGPCRKWNGFIREEMNRSGALEVVMPVVQPASCGRSRVVGVEIRSRAAAHPKTGISAILSPGPHTRKWITDIRRAAS